MKIVVNYVYCRFNYIMLLTSKKNTDTATAIDICQYIASMDF